MKVSDNPEDPDGELACLELSKLGWEFTVTSRGNVTTVTMEHPGMGTGRMVARFTGENREDALLYCAAIASSLSEP
jgi:hypothetical protein